MNYVIARPLHLASDQGILSNEKDAPCGAGTSLPIRVVESKP
jgi:hypothetical protein